MKGIQDRQFGQWLDFAADLVRCPGGTFPRSLVSQTLSSTFGAAVAWNWMTSADNWGFEVANAAVDLRATSQMAYWKGEGLMKRHPLVRWYQTTLDPTPAAMDRVPDELVPRREAHWVRELLRPLELDQQLSIPYRLAPHEHLAFVLGRTGERFPDEQLALAARIQPLICLAARQYVVLEDAPASGAVASVYGLTGREVAVLSLVTQGHTTAAIGRRLGISPRTVHKHLEHIYTKLGVTDRLTAALVGRRMGLPGPDGHEHQMRVRERAP